MGEIWYVGRKEICAYLRPYLSLSKDTAMAWQKVRRWRIKYGLPILKQPTDKPYIDPEEFQRWWKEYLRNREARETGICQQG